MGNTVASILRSKPYIGTLVNHRRTSKSFKNKKIIQIPEDEWIEVENTHEAIIDRETWDIVQKMVAVKKRPNKDGVSQIFAGLVKCPDCGKEIKVFGESHIDEIAAEYDVPVLAKLPMDPALAAACDAGKIEYVENNYMKDAIEVLKKL